MLHALLHLVVPSTCAACRRAVSPAEVLCGECRVALPWLGAACCPRCGLPIPCGRGGRCPAAALAFDAAWAPLAYAGPARGLVRTFKERGALRVAGTMAAQIAATAPPALLDGGGVLVPVPADPVRRRVRGHDHTRRLARELGRRAGLPVDVVLRRRAGPRQAGARRTARWREGHGVQVGGRAPEVAILVDDVHTTGATLHACAAVLKDAGAREVRALTYARTLP